MITDSPHKHGASALLAAPLTLCGKQIHNRIVVPPISDFGVVSPEGRVTARHMERYAAFAAGGAGLVILEACSVLRMKENRDTLFLEDDDCIPGMKCLADAIHRYPPITLVQIMLTGLSTMQENSIAEISRSDFLRYREAFLSAAVRCKSAGFDGVELHAAHGMYLNEVIEANDRNDEYGGCFENRVRLLAELIAEIKEKCGKSFIVAVRFGNPNYEELLKTAAAIEAAGGDLLDVSSGMGFYQDVPSEFPYDSKIYAASLVKAHTHLPVICVGSIFSGDAGEAILKAGLADMVAVRRGSLADPAWAKKTLAGEAPNPCLHCRNCLWYIDGTLCPARKRRSTESSKTTI